MDVPYRTLKYKLFVVTRLACDRAGGWRWGKGKKGLVFSKFLLVAVKSSLLCLHVDFSFSMNLMPSNYVGPYHSSHLSFTGTEASMAEALHKYRRSL